MGGGGGGRSVQFSGCIYLKTGMCQSLLSDVGHHFMFHPDLFIKRTRKWNN